MIRNQQIDTLSNLLLDIAKGLFLAAFGIQFVTGVNLILFYKAIVLGFLLAFCALKVLELKKEETS